MSLFIILNLRNAYKHPVGLAVQCGKLRKHIKSTKYQRSGYIHHLRENQGKTKAHMKKYAQKFSAGYDNKISIKHQIYQVDRDSSNIISQHLFYTIF